MNFNKTFSIESVNYTLKVIGFSHVAIVSDPADDGRITMIFSLWSMFGEKCLAYCLTDCMNAKEWLEQFTEGRWHGVIPGTGARSRSLRRKRQLEMRRNG
ncbi:hypothetical protein Y030_2301 [Burkholderia pseudomallei MSHR332]|nr:hypothetical protein Y030_2301 [Burkholderia pseudomallei MSHR332]